MAFEYLKFGKEEKKESGIIQADKVEALYFHATRRCATCEAVEKVTKETISKNYKGKVEFVSINREEAVNKEMVEKYKVNGQGHIAATYTGSNPQPFTHKDL